MEVTRTSLRAARDDSPIPKQVSQRQKAGKQIGRYGENISRTETSGIKAPTITAKKVENITSDQKAYTKDAVKTALEQLDNYVVSRFGSGSTAPTTPSTGAPSGGGGGGGAPIRDFFSGLTNDQIGMMSTDQLVARDNRRYGNTVPEGSFGSGSLKTIQDSPGSAVDTNIARHAEGTSEDQPPTVKFEKEKGGQGGLPLGTTTLRDGEKPTGPAVNASSFQQKNVRGSTSFGGTGKDESTRPKQTVAALPSNYKATEKAAFDKAKSWQDSKAKGQAATKATGIPSGSNLKAGSFGISAAGKKQAEANKAEKKAAPKVSVNTPAKAVKVATKVKDKNDKRGTGFASKPSAPKAAPKKATPAQKTAVKKSTTVKKSTPNTSKSRRRGSSGTKSSSSKKSSSKKSGGSKSGGSKSGGSKSAGSKKASRGAKGGSSSRSRGGTSKGTSRRTNRKRSRRRCDIRCKFDISILTNLNLIRDDLADVAYFVKDLQEIN